MESNKLESSQNSLSSESPKRLGTRFSTVRDTILEVATIRPKYTNEDKLNDWPTSIERGRIIGVSNGVFFNVTIHNNTFLTREMINKKKFFLDGNFVCKNGMEGAIKISPKGINYGDSYYEAYWLEWLRGDLILEQVLIDNIVYNRDQILDMSKNSENKKEDYYTNREVYLPNVYEPIPLRQKVRLTGSH